MAGICTPVYRKFPHRIGHFHPEPHIFRCSKYSLYEWSLKKKQITYVNIYIWKSSFLNGSWQKKMATNKIDKHSRGGALRYGAPRVAYRRRAAVGNTAF